MKKFSLKFLFFGTVFTSVIPAFSQLKTSKSTWNLIEESSIPISGTRLILPSTYATYQLNASEMRSVLNNAKRMNDPSYQAVYIDIPKPDRTFGHYKVYENETMSEGLANSFPLIRSYDGVSEDGSGESVKLDFTLQGFHAMIMCPGKATLYVDPYAHLSNSLEYYTVYSRANYAADKGWFCSNEAGLVTELEQKSLVTTKSYGNCTKRTYRIAISATGEYTAFHGGTVALAQSAQVTTMNRVNGVYMREAAVTMTIIPNNNLIVYTNSATDPFTNGSPGTMINQNQTNTTTIIGNANYDIGHVFGTNSGGLAGLGVVCSSSSKASGVTGSGAPIGDPFDIDYVAHEIGHQFSGNHTFRASTGSCGGNANNATSMEPGSGTSIMAYAGICAPQNIQPNSDDDFHAISLQEIHNFINSGSHTCPVSSVIAGQSAPVITLSSATTVSIPANTPFSMSATATDADGDILTYSWDQMNAGTATTPQPPVGTNTNGPNFRSRSPEPTGTRFFPSISSLMSGGPFTWEVLPTVARTLNFRCVVRDNEVNGGCNDFVDVVYNVVSTAGPYTVTYPNASGISVSGLSSMNVTWNVNGTNAAPISCTNADVLISTNNGVTWTVIANDVPNDGSEIVTIPNTATTQAIIMVQCANGTFFDISNNVFTITAATNTFTLNLAAATSSACQGSSTTYTIAVTQIGSFSTPVSLSTSALPAGTTANFSPNPAVPGTSSTLTITTTGATPAGTYPFTISGTGGAVTQNTGATLVVSNTSVVASLLTLPVNSETAAPISTVFNWTNTGIGVLYSIEISTSNTFATITETATSLSATNYTASNLLPGVTYYWRINTYNACTSAVPSSVFSFTTASCATYSNTTPVVISATGTPTITSTLNVTNFGTINDLNLSDFVIDHTWINDLTATLTSPAGTTVTLISNICSPTVATINIDCQFDDEATTATLPCPPTGGGAFIPEQLLSAFDGEQMDGVWTLTVTDGFNQDGGSLISWELGICFTPTAVCDNPDSPALSGTTALCPGSSTTLNVVSGNLNDATDWKWYSGSCGGTLVNTGLSFTTSTPGTYYVRGEGGCVSPGLCETITVTTTTINTIVNLAGNTLTSAQTGAIYQWVNCPSFTSIAGAVNQNFTATTSGNYAVIITRNGCVDTSNCIAISCIVPSLPVVTGTLQVCTGQTTNLTITSGALNEATSWNWYSSSCGGTLVNSGLSYTNAPIGTYFVRGEGGCVTGGTCQSVTVASPSINTTVNLTGVTLSSIQGGASYQWVRCPDYSPIAGATSQNFTANANGNYAVILTVSGCSDTSACTAISSVGLEENALYASVFPNPTNGKVSIQFPSSITIEHMLIQDVTGRIIYQRENSVGNSIEFDLENEAKGVYFIRLYSGETKQTVRLIKQ
jgi:subtilisin-like proprotein convertase family protein